MAGSHGIPPVFQVERFFSKYLWSSRGTLSSSSTEQVLVGELLEKADEHELTRWRTFGLGYIPSKGDADLLAAIAAAFYPSLDPDVHLLTCAPQEGINLIANCLIDLLSQEGPFHAIVTFPAYQSLYEWLRMRRVALSLWTADASDPTRWRFDVAAMKALVRPDTRLLVVNFPHNPTGFAPTSGEWEALVRWCNEAKIVLFSDEIYRYLAIDPEREILRPACEISRSAITLCGLSKCFGMPGLRSGWVASQDRQLIDRCCVYKDYTTFCGAVPAQILSIIAVKNHRHFAERGAAIIRGNLQAMDAFLEEFPQLFVWRRPDAGSVGLLELRPPLLQVFKSGEELNLRLKEEADIVLLPGSAMETEEKFVRIGLGHEDFSALLGEFRDFLKRHVPCCRLP